MDSAKYKVSIQERMITITENIVTKKIHPLEGIRELLKLRHRIDLSNDKTFLPLIGIGSETDEFPLGKVRELCSKEMLNKYDHDLNEYLAKSEGIIEETCLKLKTKLQSLKF